MDTLKRMVGKVFGTRMTESDVKAEIQALRALPAGWNSHQAAAISDRAITAALAVVDLVALHHAPLPSAAPTPFGGVALAWEIGDRELQLLVDEESFDYSVAQRAHPKVLDEAPLHTLHDVEVRFVRRYLLQPA